MSYTERLIVVMRAGSEADANVAAKLVDTVGGEHTFNVPLRNTGDATDAVAAAWCSWAMTPAERQALLDRLGEQGLLDDEVVLVMEAGEFVPSVQARCFIFDAADWTRAQVLAALELDTLASV